MALLPSLVFVAFSASFEAPVPALSPPRSSDRPPELPSILLPCSRLVELSLELCGVPFGSGFRFLWCALFSLSNGRCALVFCGCDSCFSAVSVR